MKISTREMILVSLFTALTAIGAFLSIPIGDVPITLQSMFSLLAGILLGPKLGSLSQILYVLLGLFGVRIFANFTGGPQSIFKPSFGFLIGLIFASYIVGKIVHKNKSDNIKSIFSASLLGTFIIYLFGIPYMYLMLNSVLGKGLDFFTVLKTACLIFIPGDLFKAILSSFVASKLVKRIWYNSN
ncbi:biotin transporter BioY [Schnuerera sp. xch1]|uniref:biotin transporter BioY n=1 Tax=Schnuerera sp. xch1 TaxID=2874283 RepID=UPI001CBE8DC5|nr:biotin transporter BioY [Schnuerera sp. xch1]MBZ2175812.1 biotin transporter BioY [Schnuerera sp. xch1]